MGINNFSASSCWCSLFMKRYNFSLRSVTSIGQHEPANSAELVVQFRNFIKKETVGVDISQLGNFDEVPVSFDLPSKHTVETRGSQDVTISTTGKF